jgi:hypothetical protein
VLLSYCNRSKYVTFTNVDLSIRKSLEPRTIMDADLYCGSIVQSQPNVPTRVIGCANNKEHFSCGIFEMPPRRGAN